MRILGLDVSGTPRRWLEQEEAITYHAKGMVVWDYGSEVFTFRGGTKKDGTQSLIESKSIIAIKGKGFEVKNRKEVVLSNRTLFGRDRYTCGYCGGVFSHLQLSRDHIDPRYKGGEDTWMNVVTACKSCNTRKGHKSLKEFGHELIYLPYVPNHAEELILKGRNILGCQMDFLMTLVPKHSRLN